MHCLVTGASGYIGRELVVALHERGYRVTAVCRQGAAPGVADESVTLDLSDTEAIGELAPRLAGVQVVFHLAGIAHQRASSDAYRAINVDASVALGRMALAAGVRRFIFASSIKAMEAEQDRAPDAPLDYAHAKRLAELRLGDALAGGSTELTIVRPALVYGGRESGHLALLRQWVRWRLPRPPAGGCLSMVARDDLVALLCLAAAHGGRLPDSLTVTDGESYDTRRLHQAYCRALNREPLLPSPPAALWRLGAWLFDQLRGEASGSTWQRLTGEACHPAAGLERLAFEPALRFEEVLGS